VAQEGLLISSAPYEGRKVLDVYRRRDREALPVVLLWHGSGPNERDALSHLARVVASKGALCLVPDWQSDEESAGRADLLASISFCRDTGRDFGGDPARISLCGWSLGANAAADLLLHPSIIEGWRPRAFVGLAGDYGTSPISGGLIIDDMRNARDVPCLLVHGTHDHIVPATRSRESHEALTKWGWQSTLKEVDTDHSGIIGARYDQQQGRCVISDEPSRVRAVHSLATWIFQHIVSA
jgi:predicted esterase